MDAAWWVPGIPLGALARWRPLPHGTTTTGGQNDPQPPGMVSLLIISAGCPWLWCHHRLFLDVLDLSGWGRRVWLFPPLPMEQQGPDAWCCGWVLPSSFPSQPHSPIPKGWKLLGVTQH